MARIEELFDRETMTALRALRKDRSLVIAGGWRPYEHVEPDTETLLTDVIIWMNPKTNDILAGAGATPEMRIPLAAASLIEAMLDSDEDEEARLPNRIIVESTDLADAIRRPLNRLGVTVVVEPIAGLDPLVAQYREDLEATPTWMTRTAAALPLYQASAALWAAAPWSLLPEDSATALLEIKGQRMYANALGDDEDSAVVVFFLSEASFRATLSVVREIDESDDDEEDGREVIGRIMKNTEAIYVTYSHLDDAPEEAVEFIEGMRVPVPSPDVIPLFVRTSKDAEPIVRISDEDAATLRLAMEALARFCLDNKARLLNEETPLAADVLVRDGDQFISARVTSPVPSD